VSPATSRSPSTTPFHISRLSLGRLQQRAERRLPADGYARLNGMGAVCTTYGVGELSVLAAIGGSYAEHLPIFHLVGMPNMSTQSSRALMHHTLGNGEYDLFASFRRRRDREAGRQRCPRVRATRDSRYAARAARRTASRRRSVRTSVRDDVHGQVRARRATGRVRRNV
jgi:Thiamine pyrophosphate enzyme, N-terminal TPP binding domain